MNRRGKARLKLQQTLEGLSVAAVTYYVVGLIGYLTKGMKSAGLSITSELVMAFSFPIVMLPGASGIRRIRDAIMRTSK